MADFTSLCRVCAEYANPAISLLDPGHENEITHLDLEIDPSNGFPTTICSKCLKITNQWLGLKLLCGLSQKYFSSVLGVSSSSNTLKKSENREKSVQIIKKLPNSVESSLKPSESANKISVLPKTLENLGMSLETSTENVNKTSVVTETFENLTSSATAVETSQSANKIPVVSNSHEYLSTPVDTSRKSTESDNEVPETLEYIVTSDKPSESVTKIPESCENVATQFQKTILTTTPESVLMTSPKLTFIAHELPESINFTENIQEPTPLEKDKLNNSETESQLKNVPTTSKSSNEVIKLTLETPENNIMENIPNIPPPPVLETTNLFIPEEIESQFKNAPSTSKSIDEQNKNHHDIETLIDFSDSDEHESINSSEISNNIKESCSTNKSTKSENTVITGRSMKTRSSTRKRELKLILTRLDMQKYETDLKKRKLSKQNVSKSVATENKKQKTNFSRIMKERKANNSKLETSKKTEISKYSCGDCKFVTFDPEKMQEHITTAQCKNKFKCRVCSATFHMLKSLHDHQQLNHPSDKYNICTQCNKNYRSELLLLKHKHDFHKDGFVCKQCGQYFIYRLSLENHICKTQHKQDFDFIDVQNSLNITDQNTSDDNNKVDGVNIQPEVTPDCEISLSQNALLEQNNEMIEENNDIIDIDEDGIKSENEDSPDIVFTSKNNNSTSNELLSCSICFIKLPQKDMKKHFSNHKNSIHECKYCFVYFNSITDLNEHIKTSHSIDYKCLKCYLIFKTERLLKLHDIYVHSFQDIFVCATCGRCFDLKNQYDFHSKLRLCYRGNVCREKEHLLTGSRIDEDPASNDINKCDMCDEVFDSHEKCLDHKFNFIHEEITCEFCGKIFYAKSQLENHNIDKHSDQLSFCCIFCDQKFNSENLLDEHLKSEHYEPLAPTTNCHYCKKTFQNSWLFKDHFKTSCKDVSIQNRSKPTSTVTSSTQQSNVAESSNSTLPSIVHTVDNNLLSTIGSSSNVRSTPTMKSSLLPETTSSTTMTHQNTSSALDPHQGHHEDSMRVVLHDNPADEQPQRLTDVLTSASEKSQKKQSTDAQSLSTPSLPQSHSSNDSGESLLVPKESSSRSVNRSNSPPNEELPQKPTSALTSGSDAKEQSTSRSSPNSNDLRNDSPINSGESLSLRSLRLPRMSSKLPPINDLTPSQSNGSRKPAPKKRSNSKKSQKRSAVPSHGTPNSVSPLNVIQQSPSTLNSQNSHTATTSFNCKLCKATFSLNRRLQVHIEKVHRNNVEVIDLDSD